MDAAGEEDEADVTAGEEDEADVAAGEEDEADMAAGEEDAVVTEEVDGAGEDSEEGTFIPKLLTCTIITINDIVYM